MFKLYLIVLYIRFKQDVISVEETMFLVQVCILANKPVLEIMNMWLSCLIISISVLKKLRYLFIIDLDFKKIIIILLIFSSLLIGLSGLLRL